MTSRIVLALTLCCMALAGGAEVAENVYEGELVRFPGPWAFHVPKSHIILVSDAQLVQLTDPDQKVDLGISGASHVTSLREICEEAQRGGRRTLIFAFDYFFTQYQEGQKGARMLTPDRPAYIEHIAKISQFAQQYGIGLELSLLSPLEIGPGYVEETGESGVWMHYRKGLRDPETGAYSVQLWRQQQWVNNKGVVPIEEAGVRIFAFPDESIGNERYRVVRPEQIVDITDTAEVEVFENMRVERGDYRAVRIRIHGRGGEAPGCNRVLVVQQYRVPEMDYFSPQALPYLKGLIDRYAAAGVKLNGLYSDEMHIQQDWGYFDHHDHGDFALRYVSSGLEQQLADTLGNPDYGDFAKYLVYFCQGQEDFANDLTAREDVMHVLGHDPGSVHQTAVLRSTYYRVLQHGVVDLFAQAKAYAEEKMGHRLESRAHPTWAQSPTIDHWEVGRQSEHPFKYEYTSNFVWSNTVHQAASACHDYFKWNDFLTGNGNDHTEGGWLDRNYYALALACSTGILNEVPYSYAAHWGMPAAVSRRRAALASTYGAAGHPGHGMVQDLEHRDVNVLMLYPLDLVAADQRFGSWMVQYGYANYVTQQELVEHGRVEEGAIVLGGRRFDTVCTLFEPLPLKGTLSLLEALAEEGGTVIWSGPPPLLDADGEPALERWQNLAGVAYETRVGFGVRAPGQQVVFEGPFAGVATQTVLTDLVPDRKYSVKIVDEGTVLAGRMGEETVATVRTLEEGGRVVFLGFRPRDDQSMSLGYEMRTWFEILQRLGAYAGTGKIPDTNDNTEFLSRTTDYLACRFPNGAVSIAPHLRHLVEQWPGGFVRDREADEAIEGQLDLPSEATMLENFPVNGHMVDYAGRGAVTFRTDEAGHLIGFAGEGSTSITIDGRATVFAAQPGGFVGWAPVPEECRVPDGAVVRLFVQGYGEVRLPLGGLPPLGTVVAQGPEPASRGATLPSVREDDALVIDTSKTHGWAYVLAGEE